MPKDNENIRLTSIGPVEPSEPQGFSPDQMIRCDECLRANPPTRINCLYCAAPLPHTESSARLRRPVLRSPEKHQLGYNTILLSSPAETISAAVISEAATLIRLKNEELQRIVACGAPLPLARTASRDEAELVCERLKGMGLQVVTLSDEDLGATRAVRRVRSFSFSADRLTINPGRSTDELTTPWSSIVLIVPARVVVKRVEVKERKSRRGENEILDTSEFFSDEAVIDLYTLTNANTWRVSANGFDFSCLEAEKTLVTNENVARLRRSLEARATNARLDDTYNRLRPLLDLVWEPEQETQSSGWRRELPGKLSVGTATIKSNERQFTRYSRLLHYLAAHNSA